MEPVEENRVLLIEDDRRLAELTRNYLNTNGLSVNIENDGKNAVQRIVTEQPNLVILDIMLPGEDGISICRRIRPEFKGHVMMLTAKTDDLDQILSLEVGADDYIAKPVQPRVLLARIRALIRRNNDINLPTNKHESTTRIQFDDLIIDRSMREAWLTGQQITLTSAEFDLLWLFCANAGRVLSRKEIFEKLRGVSYDGHDRSIDVRVSRIRPKIGDDPINPRIIKTVRSRGYLFVEPQIA